jgi:hypothetical protein
MLLRESGISEDQLLSNSSRVITGDRLNRSTMAGRSSTSSAIKITQSNDNLDIPLFESQDVRVEEKKLKEIVEDDKDSDSEEDLEGYEDKDARYKYLRSFSLESNSAIVNSNAIGKGKIMTNEEDEDVSV